MVLAALVCTLCFFIRAVIVLMELIFRQVERLWFMLILKYLVLEMIPIILLLYMLFARNVPQDKLSVKNSSLQESAPPTPISVKKHLYPSMIMFEPQKNRYSCHKDYLSPSSFEIQSSYPRYSEISSDDGDITRSYQSTRSLSSNLTTEQESVS